MSGKHTHTHTPSVKQASGSRDSSGSSSTDSAPSPGGRISTVLPSEELRTASTGSFYPGIHAATQPNTKKQTHTYTGTRLGLTDAHYLIQIAFAVILSLMQFQIIQKYLQACGLRD